MFGHVRRTHPVSVCGYTVRYRFEARRIICHKRIGRFSKRVTSITSIVIQGDHIFNVVAPDRWLVSNTRFAFDATTDWFAETPSAGLMSSKSAYRSSKGYQGRVKAQPRRGEFQIALQRISEKTWKARMRIPALSRDRSRTHNEPTQERLRQLKMISATIVVA